MDTAIDAAENEAARPRGLLFQTTKGMYSSEAAKGLEQHRGRPMAAPARRRPRASRSTAEFRTAYPAHPPDNRGLSSVFSGVR